MKNRMALMLRENRTLEIQTSVASDLGGWDISPIPREACKAHPPEKYIPDIVDDIMLRAKYIGALIIYQEELTSDQLMNICKQFRVGHPSVPILLVRRHTGRGQSLNWVWNIPPSRVIDYTIRTRVLIESLNKLLEEASVRQSA